MTPFKETKEGSTHYYNDGCGDMEHNNKLEEKYIKQFNQVFPIGRKVDEKILLNFNLSFIKSSRKNLLQDMLKDCDREENEGGRILVESYLKKYENK